MQELSILRHQFLIPERGLDALSRAFPPLRGREAPGKKMADIARKPAVKWHEDSGVKVGLVFIRILLFPPLFLRFQPIRSTCIVHLIFSQLETLTRYDWVACGATYVGLGFRE